MNRRDNVTRPVCALGCAVALLAGCGSANGTAAPAGSSTAVIQIQNYAFTPPRIPVAPGSAVLVQNLDAFEHTVTSETVARSHVAGAANGVPFDTPPFTGTWTIDISAAAQPGTVIPYFCRLHGEDGEIAIAAP